MIIGYKTVLFPIKKKKKKKKKKRKKKEKKKKNPKQTTSSQEISQKYHRNFTSFHSQSKRFFGVRFVR